MTTTETRKNIEKRINELIEERSELLRGDDADGFSFAIPNTSTLAKLEELDEKIMRENESLNAIERRINAPREAVEDIEIAASRVAFPLH